mmetsp:Transcript_39140/g.47076  ORF Transcript_39140/g.47076 Transcript_39140/m.47076 type:complete len:94 (+) Transcript_39140:104-385(+)
MPKSAESLWRTWAAVPGCVYPRLSECDRSGGNGDWKKDPPHRHLLSVFLTGQAINSAVFYRGQRKEREFRSEMECPPHDVIHRGPQKSVRDAP